jgi:hypothetical protein
MQRSELIRERVYKFIRLNCVLHSMEVHVWGTVWVCECNECLLCLLVLLVYSTIRYICKYGMDVITLRMYDLLEENIKRHIFYKHRIVVALAVLWGRDNAIDTTKYNTIQNAIHIQIISSYSSVFTLSLYVLINSSGKL